VDTHVATRPAIAAPSVTLDLSAVAAAPSRDIEVGRWPVWSRLAILVGSSALLWAGLGWVAFRVLKLG
jgi:hypothetical protein